MPIRYQFEDQKQPIKKKHTQKQPTKQKIPKIQIINQSKFTNKNNQSKNKQTN